MTPNEQEAAEQAAADFLADLLSGVGGAEIDPSMAVDQIAAILAEEGMTNAENESGADGWGSAGF